jgi:hypothetical protein
MIAFVLAALVAANDAANAAPRTLAGVYLGESLSSDDLKGLGAMRLPDSTDPIVPGFASKWTWKRQGGGTMTVSLDDKNRVQRVDFQRENGQRGSIDLPCAHAFPLEDSHVNLGFAAEANNCTPVERTLSTYKVPGGSTFEAKFDESNGDIGGLLEAHWTQTASP